MINKVLMALSILTIIPVKNYNFDNANKCVKFFPVTGFILSLIPYSFLFISKITSTETFLLSFFSLLFITLITGGLHLDGLADTFDGLLSRKNKEEILKIFKDSRLGTFGVLSLIFSILIKIYAYYKCFSCNTFIPILLSLVFGRISQGVFLITLPNINPKGFAKAFHITEYKEKIITLGFYLFFISILIIFISFKTVFICLLLMILITYVFGKICFLKLGGINGDCIGALNEFVEICILVTYVSFNIF